MKIRDRSQFPPGGWQYFEPQTGWRAPKPMESSFDVTVAQITAHRQQNPRFNLGLSYGEVSNDLETFTCQRLNWDSRYCYGDQKKTPLKPPGAKNQGPGALFAERLAALDRGGKTLAEWLGAGMEPVGKVQAEQRSERCLKCPLHEKEDWFEAVTGAIADFILGVRRLIHDADMHIEKEQDLHVCGACGCDLRLKIWVPLEHINRQTDNETRAKLHHECWQLTEG